MITEITDTNLCAEYADYAPSGQRCPYFFVEIVDPGPVSHYTELYDPWWWVWPSIGVGVVIWVSVMVGMVWLARRDTRD